MKIVQKIDRQKWSDFVYHHPNGNIFQTPDIYEIYTNTINFEPFFLAVISEDQEILGVLLTVIQRVYRGFMGSLTARSIILGGPLIKDNDPRVLEFILEEHSKIAKKKAIYSQFRNLWNMEKYNKIFSKNDYFFEDHLGIHIDITKPESLLWKELHPTRRKQIRRAIKRGTYVREIKNSIDIDKAYNILFEVYKRAKLPIADKGLFTESFRKLYPRGMIKCFGAINNNKIIGVRFVLTYRETIYDWYAGSIYEFRDKYSNDLLPWEIFKWGKVHGFEMFDFGGAGKPGKPYGVRDYKKKFGGTLVEYGRYQKVHKPLLVQIGKIGFKIWQKIKLLRG